MMRVGEDSDDVDTAYCCVIRTDREEVLGVRRRFIWKIGEGCKHLLWIRTLPTHTLEVPRAVVEGRLESGKLACLAGHAIKSHIRIRGPSGTST